MPTHCANSHDVTGSQFRERRRNKPRSSIPATSPPLQAHEHLLSRAVRMPNPWLLFRAFLYLVTTHMWRAVCRLYRDESDLHGAPLTADSIKESVSLDTEELQRQQRDCSFKIGMTSLSILRFITDHRSALPVTVTTRLLDQHGISPVSSNETVQSSWAGAGEVPEPLGERTLWRPHVLPPLSRKVAPARRRATLREEREFHTTSEWKYRTTAVIVTLYM